MTRLSLADLKGENWARFGADVYDACYILHSVDMLMQFQRNFKRFLKYSAKPEGELTWMEKTQLKSLYKTYPELEDRVRALEKEKPQEIDEEKIIEQASRIYQSLDRSKDYDTPFGFRFSIFEIGMESLRPDSQLIFKIDATETFYTLRINHNYNPNQMRIEGEWVNKVLDTLYSRWRKNGFEIEE